MAERLATPGVYIREKNAFPSAVASLPTAVPAFIGYTEKAFRNGKSLLNKAVRLSSIGEFMQYFGGAPLNQYTVDAPTAEDTTYDLELGGDKYVLNESGSRFILFDALRLFFTNGGGDCYIVSVGTYENLDGTPNKQKKAAFEAGIKALVPQEEPTMVLAPDAIMLEEADFNAVNQGILMHCGMKMRDRFAILDVFEGFKARTYDEDDVINKFREGVGANALNFGAAYYPWLNTSVVSADELTYKNIANLDEYTALLEAEVEANVTNEKKAADIKAEIAKIADADTNSESLTSTLKAVSPFFASTVKQIQEKMNLLPPSAGMAGLYTMVDNSRGVWKAPANVGYNGVNTPAVDMTNDDQEDLNVTVTGKSVNAIRSFPGEGTIVWGARTLDGNSKDWRYINVRRTISFIEQSIKYAAKTYVYEANDANTWMLIRGTIAGFLNNMWKQGALAGAVPEHAYEVEVGLGSTMTPDDILEGVMRINVKLAVVRPAEFIVITFQQKMQES